MCQLASLKTINKLMEAGMSQRQAVHDVSISDHTGVARRNQAVSLQTRETYVDVRELHPMAKEKNR